MFYEVPKAALQQTQANLSTLCGEQGIKTGQNKVKHVCVCV